MIDKVNEYRKKTVTAVEDRYIHEFDKKIDAKAQSLVDKHYKGTKFSIMVDQQKCKIADAMNREMNAEFTTTMTKKKRMNGLQERLPCQKMSRRNMMI